MPSVILIIAPTAAALSVPLSGIFEIILGVIPRIGSHKKADENGDEENPAVDMETTSGYIPSIILVLLGVCMSASLLVCLSLQS